MSKKYFVMMQTKSMTFTIKCKTWKFAKWLMGLKCWQYAKIHNLENDNKCICYINRRKK